MKQPIEHALQLYKARRFDKASKVCRKIIKTNSVDIQATVLLMRIAESNNNYKQCVSLCAPLIQAYPEDIMLNYEYGRSLRLLGSCDKALKYLRFSAERKVTYPIFYEYALTLYSLGNLEEAVIAFSKAVELNPKCIVSLKSLGSIALNKGRIDEAFEIYERVVLTFPESIHSYPELIKISLMQNKAEYALELCERCLDIEPSCTGVLAFKYIALSELNEIEAKEYLFNTDAYILNTPAQCPVGYSNIEEFNNSLGDHILNNTQHAFNPEMYTTKNGWQTENGLLFEGNKTLGKAVYKMINQALKEYIENLPDDEKHPVNLGRPSKTHIEAWGVVLNEFGCQQPHVHPKSWLSGCYYIKIPEDYDRTQSRDTGCIVFGQGEEVLHAVSDPSLITIAPETGHFVIFPSYYWHHTVASHSKENRICIAFDLVPSNGWGK